MSINKIATIVPIKTTKINPMKPITKGLDYSMIDCFVKKDVLDNTSKIDNLTQDVFEQVIIQKLLQTINQAQVFAKTHPELSEEDTIQEAILNMIQNVKASNECFEQDFDETLLDLENRFLKKHLKEQNKELDYFDFKTDIKQVEDRSIDIALEDVTREKIEKILKTLTPKREQALRQRFGLDDSQPKTFEKIAQNLDVSYARARNLVNLGIERFQEPLGKMIMDEDIKVRNSGSYEDKLIQLLDR